MREIVIVSGKGGTGKTSFVGSLASLLEHKVVADCDVDAANLNLLLNGKVNHSYEFFAGRKASINPDACTGCGRCREVCRFNAISKEYVIDTLSCEGCGACWFLCPAGAVSFDETLCGHYHIAETGKGDTIVFAELLPGRENSGKLVSMVRTKAREIAENRGIDLVLIDGPPGIGCPVISSLTGAHLAVLVTEPTMTGIHDLERVLGLARHFNIPTAVVVNKGDINSSCLEDIRSFCRARQVDFLGSIPYEPAITEAQREGKTILDFAPECPASLAIQGISDKFMKRLEEL
ncbi:MAG: Septum site-determining protein MinD [Syntrophorhabdaceae bacterium PtaU1.Bin034]|jgi:MinD superfamily P-loop ATPase|nr:MAG: Septum site-determining protein MinD [Syntrophorhabdaceae bacterium PtaU1.Bin034]